ncbi:MAG: CinA family nicotinamide mononucleotide deamidase-related protein [Chloroflexi bacterium]|nr:CinA family nicotinamide mononucleotide deamidase-related protein [Chloroflexota bacterium]MDA1297558.1 CinA family nicotinamide mononucleotide deamidase-related protein [Chloroflexota bacterium]
MNAELVSIGSELLLGQIVDTNASWMAQRLAENGVNLFYKTTVGDNFDRMTAIIGSALERADVVITGGGIGPTQDDLTREAVAHVTGRAVVTHEPSLVELRERFQKRGFILTKNNERQAMVPEGAIVVKNPNGTAPAFIVEDSRGVVISLPGVPFEMKWLFDNEVLPYLRAKFGLTQTIHYRVLKVADIGESAVDDRIGELISGSENPTVGVLAHPGQVDVRITARAGTKAEASLLIDPVETQVRSLLGDHVFATDGETMASVTGDLLRKLDSTIATCEDLSAGAVADAVREAAGPLFAEGVILNSNEALDRLAISGGERPPFPDGAARSAALARAIKHMAGTEIGLAVHAVPEGDQQAENLGRGETYVTLVTADSVRARHVRSAGSGRPDRQRAAMHALSLLRRHLQGLPD